MNKHGNIDRDAYSRIARALRAGPLSVAQLVTRTQMSKSYLNKTLSTMASDGELRVRNATPRTFEIRNLL